MRNVKLMSGLFRLTFLILLTVSIVSCKDDDNDSGSITLTGKTKTYTLNSVSSAEIDGSVKFAERSDHTTLVTIDLAGATPGNSYPAHIHANTAAETGDIIVDLNAVDGSTGKSETIVKQKKDGAVVTYDQLLSLDAYVNVHASPSDLTTLVAQGDIGVNEITTTMATYTLVAANDSGITGTVKIAKRVNGTTLATVDLDGASTTGNYPVHIYTNNIATGGPVAITLNNVNGATGVSYTDITQLDSGTALTYDQLVDYNGHVAINMSPDDATIISQANVGSNVAN